jgi:hypothetical protein
MNKNYLFLILLSLFLIISGCAPSKRPNKPKVIKAPPKEIVVKEKRIKKATPRKVVVTQKRIQQKVKPKKLFTKYNIHVMDNDRDLKAHYTNWIGPFNGHSIVPLNTRVIFKKWRPGFILQIVDTGENIYFYFNKRHMTMSSTQYFNLITSSKRVLMSQFSKIDKKGIKRGKAYKGMTKSGVLAALGYPARHKTPSLKNKFWVYWQNKWLTRMIKFNNTGTVVSIVE